MWSQRLPVLLLLLCVTLLDGSALPASSSYEFTAFRMQQFNVGQHKYGCRGAAVVAEARSPDDPALTRKCVVMRASDFTAGNVREARRQNAAAIFVLLPQNMYNVTPEEIQMFSQTEAELLQKETLTPVYVTQEDEQLLFMFNELQRTAASRTSSIFIRVFRSFVTATAFQILVSNNAPIKALTDTTVVALEGVLRGSGEDPPTIVVMAHFDSYGLAPWRSFGADSNGSGVALLLELIRLFHKLYSSPRTTPQFNLMFALTGGGKYNFLGTKRWIEENLDHAESSLLHDSAAFVLCLDTLGTGDQLFAHVSKPPRPDTPMGSFLHVLNEVVSSRFPSLKLSLVHKKINLVESSVSWEHERLSLRRVPAFTLSRLDDPKSQSRGSVLDTLAHVDLRKLKRNGVIIAEALGRFMFNLSHTGELAPLQTDACSRATSQVWDKVYAPSSWYIGNMSEEDYWKELKLQGSPKDVQLFTGHMDLQDARLSSLMAALSSVPRAAQLLEQDPAQALLLDSLEQEFRHFLQHVQRYSFRMDRREPEITFFDQMKQQVVMYRVKPAAFDLFLGGCIAVYLGLVYSAVQNVGWLYCRLKAAVKTKSQ